MKNKIIFKYFLVNIIMGLYTPFSRDTVQFIDSCITITIINNPQSFTKRRLIFPVYNTHIIIIIISGTTVAKY